MLPQSRSSSVGASSVLCGWICAAVLSALGCSKGVASSKRPSTDAGSEQQHPAATPKSYETRGASQQREFTEALLLSARESLVRAGEAARSIELAERVLQIDPTRGDAFAILASQALRDRDFEHALATIQQGLTKEPKHLELLSLRAAVEFLGDDRDAFERSVTEVLQVNPRFGRIYRLVAECAQAENRFEDAISLLRRAAALESDEWGARSELAIQLLRSGYTKEGRPLLDRAAAQDPSDPRLRNTRNLYERLDRDYSSHRRGSFRLLLPNAYREPILTRVPAWLDRANRYLQQRYGNLELAPISVELYADQDSFGVRTGGAPSTALEGACFGQTIVVHLPSEEPTNLGMSLAHELSHVYHLRVSRNHVPRWFTEGLAEIETAQLRSEWSREQDLLLYVAWRDGSLPSVAQFDRVFSRAANLDDLAQAYAASAYLVEHIQHRYGSAQIRRLLEAWARNWSTAKVFASVLSTDLDQLDRSFRDDLRRRLGHFDGQYLPTDRAISVDDAREKHEARPDDVPARVALAIAEVRRGQLETARQLMAQIPPSQTKHPDVLWAAALIDLVDQKPEPAERNLSEMLANGHDGYFVRMQLALVARMKASPERERKELQSAHSLHPTATEPLRRLAALASASGDSAAELEAMAELARLDESNPSVHSRLVERYLELGKLQEARSAGEALAYLTLLDGQAHQLLARVAWMNRNPNDAQRELRLARSLVRTDGEREMLDRSISNLATGHRKELLGADPK